MATAELTVDTSDVREATSFINRNSDYLEEHPVTAQRVAYLVDNDRAFIIMTGARGLVAEMSMPLMVVIAGMRKAGCR